MRTWRRCSWLLATVLLCIVLQTQGHECVHDKIVEPPAVSAPQNYPTRSHMRRAEAAAPIRVHFHTADLQKNVADAAKIDYIEKVLVQIKALTDSALRVVPVVGNLHVARPCLAVWTTGPWSGECAEASSRAVSCGTMDAIPAEHMGSVTLRNGDGTTRKMEGGDGIPNADLVVYVTGDATDATCQNTQALAFAHACQRDQRDRPIAGYIHFCANHIKRDSGGEPEHADVMLALHELTHILGMSTSSFAFFRDELGAPRTARCPLDPDCSSNDPPGSPPLLDGGRYKVSSSTLATSAERGGQVARLVTPTVAEVAQRHFACESMPGAELEDDGGEGTAGSHWEKRVFVSEYMTGSQGAGGDEVLSLFTLAVLQDSGWYEVNFAAADEFKYGRGRGCAFAADACPEAQCTATDSAPSCTFDHAAIGYCFQRGEDPLMDGCPFVYPQIKCDSPGAITHSCDGQDCTGGAWGASTACFQTSLGRVGFQINYAQTAACYEHRCGEDAAGNKLVEIRTPDGEWHACDGTQAVLQSAGFTGGVMCPPPHTLCESAIEPPAVQELVPLDPEDYQPEATGPTSVLEGISVRQWGVFVGIGLGGVVLLSALTYLIRWRRRSTTSLRSSALSAVTRFRSPPSTPARSNRPSTQPSTPAHLPPTPAPIYSSSIPPTQHPPSLPSRPHNSSLPPLPEGAEPPGQAPPTIPLPPDLNPAEWGGLTAFRALNPHHRHAPHPLRESDSLQHAAAPARPLQPPPPPPRPESPPVLSSELSRERAVPLQIRPSPGASHGSGDAELPPGVWAAIVGGEADAVRPPSMEMADSLSIGSVEVEGSLAGAPRHHRLEEAVSEAGSYVTELARSEAGDDSVWHAEPSAPPPSASVAVEIGDAPRGVLVPGPSRHVSDIGEV